MDVQVLGPLSTDGEALSPRERAILSVLIIRSGAAMSADELADAYWGEHPPVTWPQQVKTSIARIRRRLGHSAVRTVPGGYALGLDPEVVDAVRFERLVSSARSHLLHGETERAVHAYRQALKLWRGPAYPDVAMWAPGTAESFRLGEIRKTAEEELLEARLALGDHHAVIAEAEHLVREDPLREARWAILALADYRAGRQADALATIKRARTRLREELGIEPGRRLSDLESAILHQDPGLDAPAVPSPAPLTDCPYRGLDAFGAADADTFFGRDADVDRLLNRLAPGTFVALTGASGCGKSSIALAGVVPRLQRRGIAVDLVSPLHFDDLPTPREGVVVVIDQFEELFTHTDAYVGARAASLRDLVDRGGTVLATVRSDFLDRCLAQPDLAPLVGEGIHPVLPLGPTQLREVIEEPARAYGLRLEPGLIELVLRDAVDHPTALPMLSHALLETWRRREGSVLTVDGYLAAGGIAGAVAHSAEDLYRSLPEDEQHQFRAVMLRLVGRLPDGAAVRRRAPLQPLTGDPARARLINRLVAARLVSVEADTASVTHEAIASAWPRLDAWLRDDAHDAAMLDAVSAAAGAWVAGGRGADELLRGARLQAMLDWRATVQPDLTADESALLTASETQSDEELHAEQERVAITRRQNRRLRWALVGAALLLVLAMIAGSVAVVRSRQAASAAENSQIEAVVSRSLATRQNDRDTAALLAAEAYRRWPDDARVRSALLGAMTAAGGLLNTRFVPGADRAVVQAIPGTNTALQVRDGEGGTALEIVDVATGEVRRTIDVDLNPVLDVPHGKDEKFHFLMLSGDGGVAAVTSAPWFDINKPDCCWQHVTFVDLATGATLPGTQILHIRANFAVLDTRGAVAYFQDVLGGGIVAVDAHTGAVKRSAPAVVGSQVGKPWRYTAITLLDTGTIAAAVDNRINVYDRRSLTLTRSIRLTPGFGGRSLVRDGRGGLVSSGTAGVLRVKLTTGAVTWSRKVAPEDFCFQLLALPIGETLCATPRRIATFDTKTGDPTDRGFATQVDFIPYLSGVDDRTVLVSHPLMAMWQRWRADSTGAGAHLVAPGQQLRDSEPSPDGRFIATTPVEGGPMQLWDLARAAPAGVKADGLAVLSNDIVEYHTEGRGTELQNITTGARHPYRIRGLPDEWQLFDGGPGAHAFAFYDAQLVAFDPGTGEQVGVPLRVDSAMSVIVSVGESPDGAHVLVNWFDSTKRQTEAGVFRLADGKLLVRGLPERDHLIYNGSAAIIAGSDARMERIDPETFDVVSTFPRTEGGHRHLSASRDGTTLLSVGGSNEVRLYDLDRGIPLGDAMALGMSAQPEDTPIGARLIADGNTLLTNSPAGILAWDLRPNTQARAACAMAGREFTAEEWATYFPGDKQVATCAAVRGR